MTCLGWYDQTALNKALSQLGMSVWISNTHFGGIDCVLEIGFNIFPSVCYRQHSITLMTGVKDFDILVF